MRTTININDEQLATAQELTGIEQKPALVREALKALIERESAHRLARLGGAFPKFKAAPRRRFESIVADEESSEKPFLLVNLKKEFKAMKNESEVVKTQRTLKRKR